MITVAILINGNPLQARSAQRLKDGVYKCDDGTIINHKYSDGSVALAKKLLDTIVEDDEYADPLGHPKGFRG